MLTGTFIFTLDRKSRLVIPAPFRQPLGSPVTLTAGPEASLLLVPPGGRRRLRAALTFSEPVDVSTGRVLIPYALREWAGLRPGEEVALCGTGQAVSVLPWARCLAALREKAPEGAVPWEALREGLQW